MHINFVSQTVHLQYEGTCYANANATILRAAESRIVGRELEPHEVIVQRLITKYGLKGADTFSVLK